MKSKHTCPWACDIQFQDSILCPKNSCIDHIAALDQYIFGCGGGQLFQHSASTWSSGRDGDGIFEIGAAGETQHISVHDNKAALLTGSDDCAGEIYVYDSQTKCQRKVSLKLGGKSSTVLFRTKNGEDTFYVTDHLDNVVHRLDGGGELIRSYGAGILQHPYSMALDSVGDVIVSDWLLNDVIIFAPNGKIKRQLARNNNFSAKRTFYPYGVEVDEKGFIFVSSWRENKLLLFSPSGDLVKTLLTQKDGLDGPTNMSVSNGRLVMVNCHGTQVCRYKYNISGRKEKK